MKNKTVSIEPQLLPTNAEIIVKLVADLVSATIDSVKFENFGRRGAKGRGP